MSSQFQYPIQVRYGDLDPQGHVNNARYLTFIEQARVGFVQHLGLWDGKSFIDIGFIMADAHLSFRQPIQLGQKVSVGIQVSHMGEKSFTFAYQLTDRENGTELATGSTVLVFYDYVHQCTLPIPPKWREAFTPYLTQT